MRWLVDTGVVLNSACGKEIKVFEFNYDLTNDHILGAWATHFRNHYCDDIEIDALRQGTPYSRSEYLTELQFPARLAVEPENRLGPPTRSGDFAEVLVSDYIQFFLNYWVPRTRYEFKVNRNSSEQGTDVLGLKVADLNVHDPNDELLVFEVKASFSGNRHKPQLQLAVDHSAKDKSRIALSLNAMKQRLRLKQQMHESLVVERFQDKVDRPYKELYGAAAVMINPTFDAGLISETNTSDHPFSDDLSLVIIKGNNLMGLAHTLYQRAADEA